MTKKITTQSKSSTSCGHYTRILGRLETMIMMAVHHNKIGLVKWAITQGADVNAVNFAAYAQAVTK